MAKDELKDMLYSDPNSFWRYVYEKGMDDTVRSVIEEASREMDGSGVEDHGVTYLQEW